LAAKLSNCAKSCAPPASILSGPAAPDALINTETGTTNRKGRNRSAQQPEDYGWILRAIGASAPAASSAAAADWTSAKREGQRQ
jgi:hypothetical protein